jgi:hypothetical protein
MRSSRLKENTQYNNQKGNEKVIILCVLLWSTASHYLFGYYIMCSPWIYCFSLPFWLLYYVFSFDLLLLVTFLVIILCVLLWSAASHYLFGYYIVCSPLIYCFSLPFWLLYYVFSFDLLLLITFLVIILKVMRSSRSKENTQYNDQKCNEKQ